MTRARKRIDRAETPAPQAPAPARVFLLSPASCSGKRAQLLIRDAASFPLAQRVRHEGAPLSEVFTFLSGLYFRGKVAYAEAFASPPPGAPGWCVITTSRGLVDPAASTTLDTLREFAGTPIATDCPAFRGPLERTAHTLETQVSPDTHVVLLGSIATGKYVDTLLDVFGDRLRFPAEFVGRGDMSRGGLMLRCAEEGRELEYVPVDGRSRRGPRPPRLEPRPRARART